MTERYIGLCMAAGGVVCGVDSILESVRRGRVKFLLIAADASERTKKQLTDKCKYYNVKYFIIRHDSAVLSQMLGRKSSTAAAAFGGKGPWREVLNGLEAVENSSKTDERLEERKDD